MEFKIIKSSANSFKIQSIQLFKDGYFGVWEKDNTVLAIMQSEDIHRLEDIDSLYIQAFEAIDKNKGNGKLCIKDIFDRFPNILKITGISDLKAEGFWESIGGFFLDACDNCEDIDTCLAKGFECDNRKSSQFELLREDILPY